MGKGEQIGARIKEVMKQKEVTMGELAFELDMQDDTLAKKLSGKAKAKLTAEELRDICRALQVPADHLLGLKWKRKRKEGN